MRGKQLACRKLSGWLSRRILSCATGSTVNRIYPALFALLAAGVFFVATNGNDHWSGTGAAPSRKGTDGPFATLPRALKAVREFRKQTTAAPRQRVTLSVRRGWYFLNEPLVLTPEDSDLTLAAYRGEECVISGGRRIGGWRETTIAKRK